MALPLQRKTAALAYSALDRPRESFRPSGVASRSFSAAAAPAAASYFDATDDIDVDSVAYAFMASQAMFAGLEVGVFDVIAQSDGGALNLAELQDECGIAAPRLQTLITSLTAIKALQRDSAGRYHLSPNSKRFLVSSSKQFYGDYLQYQMGRLFYHRMGGLKDAMVSGSAPSYEQWFADPETASTYTRAQHNGSVATAKALVKKLEWLPECKSMLDVGGGSGAFAYTFVAKTPGLQATVLELPEVCKAGEKIKAEQPEDVKSRVRFADLDVTVPEWGVPNGTFDVVVISYVSGSVPAKDILALYQNSFKALQPGGRIVVHDFMVNDSLDGPPLAALWALQHVTVNAEGLGLCPDEVKGRLHTAGFTNEVALEMIGGLTKVVVAQKP